MTDITLFGGSYQNFTPGQEARMYQMWDMYRAGK
jgi:hypothetical protein